MKRHWPALRLGTILFSTFIFVAALPGFGAVFLRVYENAVVQQTEAELFAEGAVIAATFASALGDDGPPRSARPEQPRVDLRTMPVLPPWGGDFRRGRPDPAAAAAARQIATVVQQSNSVTSASTWLLDRHGTVVAGPDLGASFAPWPEVATSLNGRPRTVLRGRAENPYGAPLATLNRAGAIRIFHARPVEVDGKVAGVVLLAQVPRGLFMGIYQDRGKIALGVGLILGTLLLLAGVLSRGIARPIRALSRATQQVATGHADIPDTPAMAAVEIRELFDNFRTMADRIERRSHYLRDFATAVSHEFKTPLAGIRGALELLDEHGATMTDADRNRFLGNAAADADRLTHLVQRMLDLAHADMLVQAAEARTQVAPLLASIAARLQSDTFAIEVDGPSGIARVAPEVLETAVETLLDNSRQAGARHVWIATRAEPGAILITVADDGPGIPPPDRERIFEPFFTTRRVEGGSGLGLPIVRSLLAATGATIDLVAADSGTTFEIRLQAVSRT